MPWKVRPKKCVRKSASEKELLLVRMGVRKITFFRVPNVFKRSEKQKQNFLLNDLDVNCRIFWKAWRYLDDSRLVDYSKEAKHRFARTNRSSKTMETYQIFCSKEGKESFVRQNNHSANFVDFHKGIRPIYPIFWNFFE
jgi:hypothetical protein